VAYLAVCLVAYREKGLQECLQEEAESLPYYPTLPSVYVSRSGVLRWEEHGGELGEELGEEVALDRSQRVLDRLEYRIRCC
jgi:hypothetical protein